MRNVNLVCYACLPSHDMEGLGRRVIISLHSTTIVLLLKRGYLNHVQSIIIMYFHCVRGLFIL